MKISKCDVQETSTFPWIFGDLASTLEKKFFLAKDAPFEALQKYVKLILGTQKMSA